MYEEATGDKLITGDRRTTIATSEKFRSLSRESWCSRGGFFYANYARGGDCGDVPRKLWKAVLGEFKDQVKAFQKDWEALSPPRGSHVLFLIWFGANDLYTAGCAAGHMTDVAMTVGRLRRFELANVVNHSGCNPHFIFINLPGPNASYRLMNEEGYDSLVRCDAGAKRYNAKLQQEVNQNTDAYVDIHTFLDPANVRALVNELNLTEEPQPGMAGGVQGVVPKLMKSVHLTSKPKGTIYHHHSSEEYEKAYNAETFSRKIQPDYVWTQDRMHPTDQVYRYLWNEIKKVIIQKGFAFGSVPSGPEEPQRRLPVSPLSQMPPPP
jgi:hypothetical protein